MNQRTRRWTIALVPLVLSAALALAGFATGSVDDTNGRIATNHRIVEGAHEVIIARDSGEGVPARTSGIDPSGDLVVLHGGDDAPPAWTACSGGLSRDPWSPGDPSDDGRHPGRGRRVKRTGFGRGAA